MAINRLDRDTILNRALDLADSAVLDEKDRPSGVILPTAFSIAWLQEALDLFYKKFPFQANIVSTAITIAENDTTIAIPSDMILDYKDGILLENDAGRMRRRSFSRLLDIPKGNSTNPLRGTPSRYAIIGNVIRFIPKALRQFKAELFYYQLPPVLGPTDTPPFPDDHILTQYVFLKAQEWFRVAPVGTALKFAFDIISDLQKQGIGREAEEDQIPLDPDNFGERVRDDLEHFFGKSTV